VSSTHNSRLLCSNACSVNLYAITDKVDANADVDGNSTDDKLSNKNGDSFDVFSLDDDVADKGDVNTDDKLVLSTFQLSSNTMLSFMWTQSIDLTIDSLNFT